MEEARYLEVTKRVRGTHAVLLVDVQKRHKRKPHRAGRAGLSTARHALYNQCHLLHRSGKKCTPQRWQRHPAARQEHQGGWKRTEHGLLGLYVSC